MRRALLRFVLIAAILGALGYWQSTLLRALALPLAGALTGDTFAADDLDIGAGSLDVRDLHVARDGLPLLDVARLRATYDLGALLAGRAGRGSHLSVDLDSPRLSLIRRPSGGFGLSRGAAPSATPTASAPAAPAVAEAPLDVDLHVENGSVVFVDDARRLPESRRATLEHIDGAIVTHGERTTGTLRAVLHDGDPGATPLSVSVDDDATARATVVRLRAPLVPIRAPLDYAINTKAARIGGGRLRDLDVRFYAFAGGPFHAVGSGRLEDASIAIPGLVAPLRGLGAEIGISDAAATFRAGHADLGDVRGIRLAGGIYDFGAPAFDLGLAVDRADLGEIARLFTFSKALPVSGRGRVHVGLSGPVGSPVVAIGLDLPTLAFGRYPLEGARGTVVYEAASLDLQRIRARYGALTVTVDGTIGLGAHTRYELAAQTDGPASGIPYLAAALPEARARGVGLLLGVDRRLETRGALSGEGPSGRVAGLYEVDHRGVGSFGPLFVERSSGAELAGAVLLDRPGGASGFWLTSRGVDFVDGSHATLPGLARVRSPVFAGRIDGDLAGVSTPQGLRLGGHVRGEDVLAGTVRLDAIDADVSGSLDRYALGAAVARGAFGTFAGHGSFAGGELALDGRYDGSFERLRPYTGDLGARGEIRGPVALQIGPTHTFVQARGDETTGASVRGVPVRGLEGSLVATKAGVRVYAASVGLAGGRFAGAGTLAAAGSGGGVEEGAGRLAFSLDDADARQLRSTGLGLRAGRLSAFGSGSATTRLAGGFGLAGGLVALRGGAIPASGSSLVDLRGSTVRFDAGEGLIEGTPGDVDGRVFGIGGASGPRYDFDIRVASAEARPLLRRFAPNADPTIDATFGGRVHVGGSASDPLLRGSLQVPEGEVHGLSFSDGGMNLVAASDLLAIHRGHVRVGSTVLGFSGSEHLEDGSLRVDAARLNLADFDDYFDEGDFLAGSGRFGVRFRRRHGAIDTRADTDLRHVRVRSFDLGDARVAWSAAGSRVTGDLAFGGTSGTLAIAGTVDLARHARLDRMLATSRFDGAAHLRDLDLGVWLPALGLQLPVTGRLDGDAVVRGAYPGFDLTTTATLRDGTLDHLPVTTFRIAADSTLSRTRVTEARLVLPGLALTGSGIVGLGARGTVDLRVHGASDDIGVLALRLGTGLPVTGAGEVDVHIDGARTSPRIAGGFDFENAAAGPIPVKHALGEFAIQGRDFVLSDAELAFAKSTLYLAGSLPLTIAPFGFGPAAAPITLELQTKDLELSDFAPLLPRDATLAGRIDGRVRIAGTAGMPTLTGALTLANGSLSAPSETTPIEDLGARVTFAGRELTLERLSARVGGGALGGTGSLALADLVHPATSATYAFQAHGEGLKLDLPAYGRGTADLDIALTHAPGALPLLAGRATLSDAVIPFAALFIQPPGSGAAEGALAVVRPAGAAPDLTFEPPPQPQDVRLALDLTADRNVRVRSGNVDIGSKGTLAVRGTKNDPTLSGSFDSTGGTLTYFNTLFRVQRGTVTFAPDGGLVPTLDARATSHVSAPDPLNLSRSADIAIDLSGPVTNLTIQLSSDPPYSRDQILGLLFSVPAIGGSSLLAGQTPLSSTPGFVSAGTPVRTTTSDFSVGEEAFGVLNAQFTRNLLAPFESVLSGALDLSDLNVNVDYSGQVGFTARKFLGHKVDAVFGESFGYPEQRQSFGFEYRPNDRNAAQITAFQSTGQQLLGVQTPNALLRTATNPRLTSAQPIGGTEGFSISLQRLF